MIQTIRKNGIEFNAVAGHRADFWCKLETGVWEPRTFQIFDCFLDAGTTYVDIGAWIGPTLLYAAQRAKVAYGFEPDPVAFAELSRNLDANAEAAWQTRVHIFPQAVDHEAGTLRLGSRGGGGDSMTSVLFADESASWEVEKISLAEFFAGHQLQSGKVFVKMDIESGEYALLPRLGALFAAPGMALYLSIHPWLLGRSMRERWGNALAGKIRRRLALVYHHWRLFRSLPFRHLYHEDGRAISRASLNWRALVFGEFITSVVGTHRPWSTHANRR